MTFKYKIPDTSRGFFYGGDWRASLTRETFDTTNPATGEQIASIFSASTADIDQAVVAARKGYQIWRDVAPLERARIMLHCAGIFRQHAEEIAYLESLDGGNPISETASDVESSARSWEFFAGLVTEVKGSSVPMGPHSTNFSIREPRGVVLRIAPFNHPFMFSAGRLAAPLAVGNSVIVKPPEQAPLSALLMADLLARELPEGVVNVLTGGPATGAALVSHPDVAMISLTGSVPTGRIVMKGAAERLKPLVLELGGKNALIAYDDADSDLVAAAVVRGMNFTWCSQSCGSTSRAFIHRSIYKQVIEGIKRHIRKFVPGIPTDPATSMGSLVSDRQYSRVLDYIQKGRDEGAQLLCGGQKPANPELARGYFVEPTVFVDVNQTMSIAREEIFGPVLSVIPWSDEEEMLNDVNSVEYGLTCSIWTHHIGKAHSTARRVEAGFVWINEVGKHFLGTPYGGYKQSGLGREECFEEMLQYTQEKHIHVNHFPERTSR
jgi:betaine-aldehyde dehydrogenase